jgi:hypothetical protein
LSGQDLLALFHEERIVKIQPLVGEPVVKADDEFLGCRGIPTDTFVWARMLVSGET